MARPRTAPGEYGRINTKRADGTWEASARYRRHDGKMSRAAAHGTTRTAAEAALKARIRQRLGDTEGSLSADSTVESLAALWQAQKEGQAPALAPRTLESLRRAVASLVVPLLGALTLRECTTPRIERTVLALLASGSPSNAGRLRWALGGMFTLAVRLGAVPFNPVASTTSYRGERHEPKALTIDGLMALREAVRAQPKPRTNARKGAATADVLEFLAGTGCRPGEALGLQWEDVHLDDLRPWVRIRQQVVRVDGQGLMLTPTKGKDVRNLVLPSFAADMLRSLTRTEGPVFPSATGGLRDPKSMRTIWAKAVAGTEWEWVTPKTLRKTVATIVAETDGAELAARQLGHTDDKVTRRHYIAPSAAPLALEAMDSLGARLAVAQ